MANLVLLAEAVQASSYTVVHIASLLRQGKIVGKKVGGTWMVDLDSLRQYEQNMNALGNKKHKPTAKK